MPSETPRFAVEIDEQGLPLDDLDCLELEDDEVLEEEEMSVFPCQSFSKSSSSSLSSLSSVTPPLDEFSMTELVRICCGGMSRISGFWTPQSWCTFSNLSSHFNSFNYFNNFNPSDNHGLSFPPEAQSEVRYPPTFVLLCTKKKKRKKKKMKKKKKECIISFKCHSVKSRLPDLLLMMTMTMTT